MNVIKELKFPQHVREGIFPFLHILWWGLEEGRAVGD